MPTSTTSSLSRFLLSLVIRFHQSVECITLAFRAWFASFRRSILTFARHGDSSQNWLHANDADNKPTEDHQHISACAKVEEEDDGTLAVTPTQPIMSWEDKLSKYQALTKFEYNVQPAIPERASQRYESRRVRHPANPPDIPAGRQKLLSVQVHLFYETLPFLDSSQHRPPPPPDRWRRHVHPEGNVLFYHEDLHVFTENDVFKHGTEILSCATTLIQQAIRIGEETDDVVIMDDLTEIVLNMVNKEWHYYFVDHRNRLLFWVHPVNPRNHLSTEMQGIEDFSHIRYLVEEQYWYIKYDMESRSHCEYYPHNLTLPKGIFEDLRGMLNHARTDMMTTRSSTSPFAQDELVAILDLVNSMKDDNGVSDSNNIWVIARLMVFFTENHFVNFRGQQIINYFLFGTLNDHAVRLQQVWVDGTVIHPRWKNFINRLTLEWGRYTIFSTVMLTVNFSFLAIPGVVTPGSPISGIQITIYGSVISTIGSIVFSFALANVYCDPGLLAADPAANAMRALSRTKWGMVCLAITHSLPIACLIWSTALFSVALAIQIFSPKEPAALTTLGVECLVLVLSGFMSSLVIRPFARNDDGGGEAHVDDSDDSDEKISSPKGSQHDVEEGLGK